MNTRNAFTLLILLGLCTGLLARNEGEDQKPVAEARAPDAPEQVGESESAPGDAPEADEAPAPAAAIEKNKTSSFAEAASTVERQLQGSLQELSALRKEVAEEKIPLTRKLSALEGKLLETREKYQEKSRLLDRRTLDLSNLRRDIEKRKEEMGYLSNLMGEYIRNLETSLHIAERSRYEKPLEAAKLAREDDDLTRQQMFDGQINLLEVSLDRLFELLGGTRFEGEAVDANGDVVAGTFLMLGPSALFRSSDGQRVGTVQEKLNSTQPNVVTFSSPEDEQAAATLIESGAGLFPFDPTLGNAHKIEQTQETLWEHVQKGGPVMVPIFALAGASLLVALYKWVVLMFQRRPSQRRIHEMLDAVRRRNTKDAEAKAEKVRGPVGQMLRLGVAHLNEPRDLIEEVMYEKVLATRLKLQRMLPFIAISAAAAPLLGLLGTVTGIINTFKLINAFGTGDVKTLSSGISEALVTTEFGLIVAIPSLLLHAFLSRKARGVTDQMEKAAVALVNQVSKTGEKKSESESEDEQMSSAA